MLERRHANRRDPATALGQYDFIRIHKDRRKTERRKSERRAQPPFSALALVKDAYEASKHSVGKIGGAAIETRGRIVVAAGCVEVRRAPELSMCAPRLAILKALSQGHREFLRMAIYIVGDDPEVALCASCRRTLVEFAPGVEVVIANRRLELRRLHLSNEVSKQ